LSTEISTQIYEVKRLIEPLLRPPIISAPEETIQDIATIPTSWSTGNGESIELRQANNFSASQLAHVDSQLYEKVVSAISTVSLRESPAAA
jgi:hypothetical protein